MNKKLSPDIIFQDTEILVINKPAGISVHKDGRDEEYTISDWVVENYPKIEGVGEPAIVTTSGVQIKRPGIVHRLDKDTSGVMVIAKNQESFEFLKSAFKNREVKKEYIALVYGLLKEDNGRIDKPIGKSARDFRLRSAEFGSRGEKREALTVWIKEEAFGGVLLGKSKEDFTLLRLEPKTGRTHQLRVHTKAIGHPIVCDPLYAPNRICPLGMGRQMLHAQKLTLPTKEGGAVVFEAPIPADFSMLLEELRKLC